MIKLARLVWGYKEALNDLLMLIRFEDCCVGAPVWMNQSWGCRNWWGVRRCYLVFGFGFNVLGINHLSLMVVLRASMVVMDLQR